SRRRRLPLILCRGGFTPPSFRPPQTGRGPILSCPFPSQLLSALSPQPPSTPAPLSSFSRSSNTLPLGTPVSDHPKDRSPPPAAADRKSYASAPVRRSAPARSIPSSPVSRFSGLPARCSCNRSPRPRHSPLAPPP